MINERLAAQDAIRTLHERERRGNRIHAFQNAALLAAILLAGSWSFCSGGLLCRAGAVEGSQAAPAATHAALSRASEDGKVDWLEDYPEALARSKKLGRPVLIDFAASWCVPCRMMEKHVWPDESVQQALDSKVVPLRIDMDSDSAAELAKKYRVEFVPTILLIDANENELAREGFLDAEQLIEMIKNATRMTSD